MNLFVTKLNYNTNELTLETTFTKFGEVSSAKIIYDRIEQRSKGFGFVEMPNDDEGQNAINGLNDSELDGRTIVVKKAEPRERRDNRGGGGGGGYRGGGDSYNRRY